MTLCCPLFLSAQQKVNIIPKPVNLVIQDGSFSIDANTSVRFDKKNSDLQATAKFLAAYVHTISGYELKMNNKKSTKNIDLKIENTANIGDEGYMLNVSPSAITIRANTKAGVFYGLQSIIQTLPPVRTNAALTVPCMQVTDYPRFKWRGMHLDVSRHFFSPELVKEYINLIAQYKMNTFHWHLVDDQGWRIEIKKYPKLTEVGAWRVDQNDKAWGDRPQAKAGEKPTYGGYYTQEQIKDIVAYAAVRNVTVVPEIEMPGHVASAVASYPHLSCTQQAQLPMTGGNYTNMSSNYCAGNDSVFTFLEDVLTEVVDLFPSKYIHIGGDELDKGPWKKCARCQARIKTENLKNEEELQSYFIARIEKFLISKNRKMIGWDEILEGGLAPEATVMSWRGEAGGIEAAKMKHDVIMTPGNPVYFDHYQAGPEGEPQAFGGFNTLKKVYNYEPIPKELNADEAKFVLGAQANLWTESIVTAEHVEYMILPRMPALAEVVWSPKESRNWGDFNERIQSHFKGYGQKGLRYCPGNFTIDIKPSSQSGKLSVALSTEAYKGEIYYTTDGSNPTISSSDYTGPINIDSSVVIKAVTVLNGNVMGVKPAEQAFIMHKAIGRDVVYSNPISTSYLADGPNSLTDGVRGTKTVNKYWHGISGKDLIATIDLGAEQEIKSISLGCLQNYSDWIFLPQEVKFEVSADGKNFKEAKVVANNVSVYEKSTLKSFKAELLKQKVRYVRVSAKNGVCPPNHPGAGKPAWIFADELVVE